MWQTAVGYLPHDIDIYSELCLFYKVLWYKIERRKKICGQIGMHATGNRKQFFP